jgi:hypothetical protein
VSDDTTELARQMRAKWRALGQPAGLAMMNEAADRLEQLETQRDDWKARWEKALDDLDTQTNRAISAELKNQRLRAIVTQLADCDPHEYMCVDDYAIKVEDHAENCVWRLAREAIYTNQTETGSE